VSADLVEAWILRNQQDPEEIVGIGFYKVGDDVAPLRWNLDRLTQDEHRHAHAYAGRGVRVGVETVRVSTAWGGGRWWVARSRRGRAAPR